MDEAHEFFLIWYSSFLTLSDGICLKKFHQLVQNFPSIFTLIFSRRGPGAFISLIKCQRIVCRHWSSAPILQECRIHSTPLFCSKLSNSIIGAISLSVSVLIFNVQTKKRVQCGRILTAGPQLTKKTLVNALVLSSTALL